MSQEKSLVLETELQPGEFFLSAAGTETVLIFEEKCDLPEFAAFVLLKDEKGIETLRKMAERHISIGKSCSKCRGFILETPTWRASLDWASKLGMSKDELTRLNILAVQEALALRKIHDDDKKFKIVISGLLGPRGDGYIVKNKMTASQAEEYHLEQIQTLAQSGVDLITCATLSYVDEAIGVVRAAKKTMIAVEIGFTVETDGTLADGMDLKEAIETVDQKANGGPSYYMINCAHFDHFKHLFTDNVPAKDKQWLGRIKHISANPSRKSHSELDSSPSLDAGDPVEFGTLNAELKTILPDLRIMGGCCGTSDEHLKNICSAIEKTFKI